MSVVLWKTAWRKFISYSLKNICTLDSVIFTSENLKEQPQNVKNYIQKNAVGSIVYMHQKM